MCLVVFTVTVGVGATWTSKGAKRIVSLCWASSRKKSEVKNLWDLGGFKLIVIWCCCCRGEGVGTELMGLNSPLLCPLFIGARILLRELSVVLL